LTTQPSPSSLPCSLAHYIFRARSHALLCKLCIHQCFMSWYIDFPIIDNNLNSLENFKAQNSFSNLVSQINHCLPFIHKVTGIGAKLFVY
jgi:hypothetical protein